LKYDETPQATYKASKKWFICGSSMDGRKCFLWLFTITFVFYRYVYSARNAPLQAEIKQTNFQEQVLQDVLQIWDDRALRLEEAGKGSPRKIFSPFQPPVEESPEVSTEDAGTIDL
jgi:hypothetical protein